MSFDTEKQVEIEKLQKINKVLEKIVSSPVSLVENDELLKIQNLLEKNKSLINKLQKDEFEIAIVGLEKAGKSTFANALIKSNILPSAPERCTFTSTKLMYSPEDKAKISFYTKEEFNKIFRSMLKDLEFPNAENVDFMTLSLNEFENYFNNLAETNSSLYKEHVGKTNEEIIDILKNKNKINSLLNKPPVEFIGEEKLKSKDFQSYITGIRLESGETDTSRPRAVKSLEIFSSNLHALQTAIIYDVPGFDSPTKIHERQTLERLRKADIIILVTNAGRNPSLVGTQLNIITKNTDEDGIPLRDKLFVFGNQIDLVNKKEDVERNKTTLINDVLKYQIGIRERVYVGSAYKYLVENNLIKDDYQCRFDISSGIDEIREGVVNYYKNDRFEILKRRIENIKDETITLRNKLKEQFSNNSDISEIEKRKMLIILNEVERIKKDIKEELDKIRGDIKRDIYESRYFSNKFRENIENEEYFPELTVELYEKIKREEDKTISTAESPEAVNDGVRKKLYDEYLDSFIDLILDITDKEAEKLHERIIKAVAKAIVSNASFNTKELEEEVEKFMKGLSSEITHNRGRFLYLIERFSRPVFDGLILRRVLSEDRKEIFEKYKKEFEYLDSYYSDSQKKLLNMMLGAEENFVKKTAKTANEVFSRNKIQKKAVDFMIDEILKDLKKAKTDEEIIEEINKDITNLKKILSKAVIEAVFLELAFLNSLDKEIKILMDSFENRESENLPQFNKFISDIVYRLKEGELEAINFEIEQNRLKKEIVEELFEIGI